MAGAGEKTCSRCLQEKPLADFGSYRSQPDGKHRLCRVCVNERDRAMRAARATVFARGAAKLRKCSRCAATLATATDAVYRGKRPFCPSCAGRCVIPECTSPRSPTYRRFCVPCGRANAVAKHPPKLCTHCSAELPRGGDSRQRACAPCRLAIRRDVGRRYTARKRAATEIEVSFDTGDWRFLLHYYGNRCGYCYADLQSKGERDHFEPLSKGGTRRRP